MEAGCDYFITTDGKIWNKFIGNIVIIDPIDFVKVIGA
jgi:hypothetical protein